ncbi:arginase family protein [uncultured Adlercreutzia sp.]|uniref:arginase family protein n=1 Tax=uncultured Adlercreutzia sp. TaxID=875803 RepID=UPI0026F3ABC6|nr:arginase family protein [uncultured Adlercreutzia sp.]
MRRASELPWVSSMIQFGSRGLGSSGPEAFREVKEWGSVLVSAPELRRDLEAALDRIPDAPYYYITLDVDGLDSSICPGTGSPQPGGILYEEARVIIERTCQKGPLVGFDVREVWPPCDLNGQASLYAAQLMLDAICFALDREWGVRHKGRIGSCS